MRPAFALIEWIEFCNSEDASFICSRSLEAPGVTGRFSPEHDALHFHNDFQQRDDHAPHDLAERLYWSLALRPFTKTMRL
jgi:hypothetical protein